MYGVLLSFGLWARQDFKLYKFQCHAKKGSSPWPCVLRLYLYFLVESNGLWLLMCPQVTPHILLQNILNSWHCSQFCCRLGDIYSNIVIQIILNIFSVIDSNLDKSDLFLQHVLFIVRIHHCVPWMTKFVKENSCIPMISWLSY
jgi:hypothetical protein